MLRTGVRPFEMQALRDIVTIKEDFYVSFNTRFAKITLYGMRVV